jgi:hypothetical protein
MPSEGEIRALFKVVQDTSVKKVIDNVKGEVRSVGAVADSVGKQVGTGIFKNVSEAFRKLNPNLKELLKPIEALKGLRDVSGKDLAKVQALPDINDLEDSEKKPSASAGGISKDFQAVIKKFAHTMGISTYGLARLGVAGIGVAAGFSLLQKSIRETSAAYENARNIYAKSLVSGLSIGFVTKRSLIAETLGVSENEIFRFGAALGYLAPKLSWASDTLAKTTIPLTAVSYQLKIMQKDFSALFALIAAQAAPVILNFVQAVSEMIKAMADTETIKQFVDVASKTAAVLVVVVAGIATAIGSFVVGLQLVFETLEAVIAGIYNLSLKLLELAPKIIQATVTLATGSSFAGKVAGGYAKSKLPENLYENNKLDIKTLFQPGVNSANELGKFIKGAGKLADVLWKGTDNKFKAGSLPPPPQSQMKQLPAGAFEKMGLIIGGGMADKALEYQRRTATAVEKLYQAATQKNQKTSGYYMGRNPYVAGH